MATQRFRSHGFEFEFEDNTGEVLAAFQNAVNRALHDIGGTAADYARAELNKSKPYMEAKPPKPAVDTSALLQSVSYVVDGDEVYIGTNNEAGPFIEFGTGKFSTLGGGTPKESWIYQDALGQWHRGFPMMARPFLKPAATEHTEEYREKLKNSLENA